MDFCLLWCLFFYVFYGWWFELVFCFCLFYCLVDINWINNCVGLVRIVVLCFWWLYVFWVCRDWWVICGYGLGGVFMVWEEMIGVLVLGFVYIGNIGVIFC